MKGAKPVAGYAVVVAIAGISALLALGALAGPSRIDTALPRTTLGSTPTVACGT